MNLNVFLQRVIRGGGTWFIDLETALILNDCIVLLSLVAAVVKKQNQN
jgi:hypothetical protein